MEVGQLTLTTFINVLVISSMYIVVALGFAFLFNILGVLNLAHGAVYMAGAYMCYALAVRLGINPWIGMVLAVIVMGLLGLFLEKFAFRPVASDQNRVIVVCVGISVILQTSVNVVVGKTVDKLPAFVSGIITVGPVSFGAGRLATFLIGGALLAFMIWFINNTQRGQQMQAVSQNMVAAALHGINVHRISGIATVIAFALAVIAGCLMGALLNLNAFMGDAILLKAIIILILGGIGSIGGIFFGGIIIGGLDAVLPVFLEGAMSDAIALAIIIAILIVRPQGLFGHEVQ
ncbi:MAG: inner-rane translocator [Chloroflexi bacterium]|jgi:branched-chain amino acid transport system permease protein|nr:inner-rane translocator [Chloroflexota bacterium]